MRYSFISNLLWVLLAARCISSFSFLSTSGRKCLGNGKSRDEIACRIFTRQRPLHQFETPSRTQLVLKASTLPLFSSEWQIWSILSVMSTLGIVSEKTNIGSMLSSPIVTMVATLVLSNLGLIPSSSPVYTIVMQKFVPLAIPLLLLDADLRKCIKVTGRLLRAFLVGSVGTVVGTLIAFLLVPMKNIAGADKIASALCARHIGGAVNFVAVSDILKISPDVVAAALAADNIVVALYFTLLFAVTVPDRVDNISKGRVQQGAKSAVQPVESPPAPVPMECPVAVTAESTAVSSNSTISTASTGTSSCPVSLVGDAFSSLTSSSTQVPTTPISTPVADEVFVGQVSTPARRGGNEVTLPALSSAISIGLVLYSVADVLGRATGFSSLVTVSLLTVLVATVFPRPIGSVSRAGGAIGVLIMQMFFAVTGASGHISAVLRFGPGVFVHTAVQVVVHFIVAVGLGRLLKLPFKEMALASNANVGGPTTAAAMASNKRWNALVLPALLTGVFGYAIATAVGVAMMKPLALIAKLHS